MSPRALLVKTPHNLTTTVEGFILFVSERAALFFLTLKSIVFVENDFKIADSSHKSTVNSDKLVNVAQTAHIPNKYDIFHHCTHDLVGNTRSFY